MKNLIKKEIKDLIRDPRIILPFLLSPLILVIIGFAVGSSMQTTAKEIIEPSLIKVGIVDLSNSKESKEFVNYLMNISEEKRLKINLIKSKGEIKNILKENQENEVFIFIPKNFSEALNNKERINIEIYSIVKEIRIAEEEIKQARILRIIESFIQEKYLKGTELNATIVENPIKVKNKAFLINKDLIVDSSSLTGMSLSSIILPIFIIVIGMIILQISSTSVAIENEYKTLEVLLLLPISRFKLLLSKLLGTFIVSLIGSIFFIVGFIAYIAFIFGSTFKVTENQEKAEISFQIQIDPFSIFIIVLSLIISLFFVSCIGVITGALSNDVRLANTLIGPLSIFIAFPIFFVIFGDVSSLDFITRSVILSLPLIQTGVFMKNAITINLDLLYLIYVFNSFIIILIIIYLASKIIYFETLTRLQYSLRTRRFFKIGFK